ncbi:MAG: hypothetical protein L6Q83_00340, partial [Gammaproteobacteria bacterium]|nr:hypothetical protein [Gammaproteobacteria bacterium]
MTQRDDRESSGWSRREMLAAGSVAAASLAAWRPGAVRAAAAGEEGVAGAPQPPFDSLRDYVAALQAHGLLMRFDRVDQDAYHATGLVYRLNDRFSYFGVPALWFDEVRIGGRWVRGPLLGLLQGNILTDSLVFGQPLDFD